MLRARRRIAEEKAFFVVDVFFGRQHRWTSVSADGASFFVAAVDKWLLLLSSLTCEIENELMGRKKDTTLEKKTD